METLKIKPQFVTDGAGQNLGVFLPMVDFKKLLDELEDYADIKAFDEAEGRKDRTFVPFEQAVEEMKMNRSHSSP